MGKIYVLGGGTFNHVRSHLSLAAPAFGTAARRLSFLLKRDDIDYSGGNNEVQLVLTRMADAASSLVTNEDVERFIREKIEDPSTRGIVFSVAMTDYTGEIDGAASHKYAMRLESRQGRQVMTLTPSAKVISEIRRFRKDIFVVGFKTTAGASDLELHQKSLRLLKESSINLVLGNDIVTRRNMIVVPEESRYVYDRRDQALEMLSRMMTERMKCTYTRSHVVPGTAVPWKSDLIDSDLRKVVDHCISRGAYKPFEGKTAGHFAVKLNDRELLTSIRKSNFNDLASTGMVHMLSTGPDDVTVRGFKPSVGGQSQRIIFRNHPHLSNIVHFHCPMYSDAADDIPIQTQWQYECGSHQCGQNTSDGLKSFDLGDGDYLSAVFLEKHGPNIVFPRDTPAAKVINFIERNFDLEART